MKEKKGGNRVILAAFILFLCLLWPLWFLLRQHMDTANHEKRELAALPSLSVSGWSQFPKEFDRYFNDHIPFRNELVTLNNSIDYYVFQSPSDRRVLIGRDNWLFFSDKGDGDPVACYQGTNLLSEEELAALAENCLRQQEYLASLGKEFVIFIAPNKERVYSEYMPWEYGAPAEQSRVRQIVDYLREHTSLRVVYPYEELMRAKETLAESIYYKTDTHWNPLGACVGSRALLRELGITFPDLTAGELSVTDLGPYTGDLADMLGMSNLLDTVDRDYAVERYTLPETEKADPRKFLMIVDSFGIGPIPYLQSQFTNSDFITWQDYTADFLPAFNPDVVVYEVVERLADRLAAFSLY